MILWAMLIGLIFCQAASALSYSSCAVFSNTSTDWQKTESMDKFDPSLGVLTKVVVTADACASQSFIIDSEDNSPQCWSVTSDAVLSTPMPDGSTLVLALPVQVHDFCLTADQEADPTDFEGTDAYRFFVKDCIDSEKEFTAAEDLQAWIGPGSVSFTTTADGTTEIDGSANFDQRIRTHANETICVTY